MRLTLVILLVVGTAAVLVSSQESDQRRQARQRFRALAQAARSGDVEAQNILKSHRRQRPSRQRAQVQPTRSSAVPPRPVFQDAVQEPAEVSRPIRVRVPVRRNRVRARPTTEKITTFHPPTTEFVVTPAPEPVFPETEETIIATEPTTEAPVFRPVSRDPVTEEPLFPNPFEQPTSRPFRPRTRPTQSRPVIQSRPSDDFSINFDLEPHRALNTGLEVDSRSEHIVPRLGLDRTTEAPVETIRRYSYFDEQGSYVFGYEAADGSFKEEVRRLDCVVEGKYGYVDPDGIRREFTYTSGNQCDPNAVPDPETQEVQPLPLNDQFLQQTQEQRLTEDQLDQLHFNRRRRPVQQTQTVEQNVPRRKTSRRPSRPVERPARPSPIPVRNTEPVFPEVTDAPIRATPAPARVFTTPASFNRFTTPESLRPKQEQFRPQPTRAPAPEQEDRQTTHQAFRPPEGPSFRPTPKPIAFDFDREFNNLFSNFGGPRPTTRPPVFNTPRPTPRPTTRPPPPPTTRPPPPPPPPSTFQPAATHSSLDDGSQTLSGGVANQLVFDAASGTFKNVPVQTGSSSSNRFLPQPAPNPFAPRPSSAPTTFATRPPPPPPSRATSPFTPATPAPTRAPVGRPLPTANANFDPTSHFVINQNGRSPAAAEFDKFFSQFNLKF